MRKWKWPSCLISHLIQSLPYLLFIQNVFSKPKGANSSAVPVSQTQVIVSLPSGSAVSAGRGYTSAFPPSSISGSAAASLQPPAQFQQVALTHRIVRLRCQHCNHLFATKPELLFYKVKRDHEGDWRWVYPIEAFLSFHLWQSLSLLWSEKKSS